MKSILMEARRPDITFHRSGLIELTSRIAKMLDLHDNDAIDILRPDDDYVMPDCYLVVHKDAMGSRPRVRPSHKGKRINRHYRAHSVVMCRYILRLCHQQERVSLNVGERVTLHPYGYALPLITAKYNR